MTDDDRAAVSGAEVLAADLPDWRLLRTLRARFRTGSFMTGLELATGIAEAAEAAGHHPDLDLRYGFLDVALTSHDVGAVTRRDLSLARTISELARGMGVSAEPESPQLVELALDTADRGPLKPFWRAVLGLVDHPELDDELTSPDGQSPMLWFQQSEPHGSPHQRFHLDVWVPHDVAQERVAAAVAAGGTLVSDEAAPSFWVLADADGNHACLCTWQERD
jgi:4a-hydroxytetrahydrobiopterin dehydratase